MTGNDVVDQALRLMLSGQRESMNKLDGAVSANATSLSFDYNLGAIQADAILGIDSELYRVWEVTGAKTVAVQPAMQGSASSSHADGALVYVNPRVSRFAAFVALNQEIMALSSPALGLYAVKTLEFTYQAAVTDYHLNDNDVLEVLDVRADAAGPENHWQSLKDWRLRRNSDLTDFATGNALFIPNGIPGRTVRVIYSTPFTTLDGLSGDLSTESHIPFEMQDILAMGIVLRLGPAREIKRNFTEAQGDARRAGEVPPQAVGNSFSYLRAQREQRIQQEAARLLRDYGPRRRV